MRSRLLALFALLAVIAACKAREDAPSSVLRDDETAGPGEFPAEFRGEGSYPIWSYDPGPDPNSAMGRELIDLNARIPFFPGLSTAIYGDQMFRPAFGPIPWRMLQKPNSVKILFIGQDGTHIAEAANRPATAGFGGRAQDLAKYFGVSSHAAFLNAYAFTIRWQYGNFDTPIISTKSGTPQMSFGSVTGNQVWLLSNDLDSPIVKWRNDLISWIFKNNKDSLKLVVLFGGAARDAMATWVISRGGNVGTRYRPEDLATLKVPEYELTSAGSNKQTAFALSKQHRDIYREMNNNQSINYKDPNTVKAIQTKVRTTFNSSPQAWMDKMVIPKTGLGGSGLLHEAQLGGFDIDNKMQVNGQTTKSLKGLEVAPGVTLGHDVLVAQFPHPTALSSMTPQEASAAVAADIAGFTKYETGSNPWKIDADPGFTNTYAVMVNGQHTPYSYKRADMGPEYYDFGAPNSRMVNVSTASRDGANVIVFGTRDRVGFDAERVKQMGFAKPSRTPPDADMWITRPFSTDSENRRYTFDPGPGEEWAKLMKTSLPRDADFVKKRAVNGDYGHYRGTFKNPQVVILADPHGEDDLITGRALTGSRGQILHGLMADLGVGDKYLVIKTAPYGQDDLWAETLEKTKGYREAILKKIFAGSTPPRLVIADGPSAIAEMARILPNQSVVNIQRPSDAPEAGIAEALASVRAIAGFESASPSLKMTDIPRSHLVYYSRVWEGTSGDRALTSNQPQYKHKAFAEVAPKWAYAQAFKMPPADVEACKKLAAKLNDNKLRMGLEKIPSYMNRLASNTPGKANCDGAASAENDVEGSTAPTAQQQVETMEAEIPNAPMKDDNLQHLVTPEPREPKYEF